MTLNSNNLYAVHRLKDAAGIGLCPQEINTLTASATGVLYIDTCLRQLVIFSGATPQAGPYELLQGEAAYSFLLQTITGLNSSVPGETNIQGQFRCAWKRWQQDAEQFCPQLNLLMQTLLKDSKQIRTRYLHNLGGASYGSLLRKLLQPKANDQILFVGSGRFSQSMLPFFSKHATALWNRRLHKHLQNDASQLFDPANWNEALQWATQVVLTTPADDNHDARLIDAIKASAVQHVVHLGRRRGAPGRWSELPEHISYNDLDHVFELRARQSTLRDLQVLRARRACVNKAQNIVAQPQPPQLMPGDLLQKA